MSDYLQFIYLITWFYIRPIRPGTSSSACKWKTAKLDCVRSVFMSEILLSFCPIVQSNTLLQKADDDVISDIPQCKLLNKYFVLLNINIFYRMYIFFIEHIFKILNTNMHLLNRYMYLLNKYKIYWINIKLLNKYKIYWINIKLIDYIYGIIEYIFFIYCI